MTHPNSQDFLNNSIGYISCPTIDIKPVGQRFLGSSNIQQSKFIAPSMDAIKKSVASVVMSSKPTAAASAVVPKSKSSIQATNFFSKQSTPAVAAAVKLEVKVEPAAVAAPASSAASPNADDDKKPVAKRVGKIAVADDEEEEEWDSGYKPDAARLKERAAAAVAADRAAAAARSSSSSSSSADCDVVSGAVDMTMDAEEDGDAVDCVDGEGKVGQKKQKQKQKNALVHGAMDDFFEDAAIAEHKAAASATGASTDSSKPKKRKLVEKVEYASVKIFLHRLFFNADND